MEKKKGRRRKKEEKKGGERKEEGKKEEGKKMLSLRAVGQSIGVGRCSDLGGDIFFKQQKCDFLEEQCLHAIRSTILQ